MMICRSVGFPCLAHADLVVHLLNVIWFVFTAHDTFRHPDIHPLTITASICPRDALPLLAAVGTLLPALAQQRPCTCNDAVTGKRCPYHGGVSTMVNTCRLVRPGAFFLRTHIMQIMHKPHLQLDAKVCAVHAQGRSSCRRQRYAASNQRQ